MKIIILYLLIQSLFANEILIDLITTNDIHGVVEDQKAYFMNPEYPPNIIGGSGFFKYINELKNNQNTNDLLLIDAGNFFQGSSFGMHDKGSSMIEWMNMIGYDALVPGQYDFIFGIENLNKIFDAADFEILGANLECDNCISNLKPYLIKEIQGIKIGILGILNSEIPELVPASKLQNTSFLFEVETMQKWIPQMKENGADVIIVLTSSGVPWDREEVYDDFLNEINHNQSLNAIQMGYYAQQVDLIISGGISKGYKTAWYDPYSHVYTIQNYGNGTSFGHIKLRIDSEHKKFLGIEYANNNEASYTLFSDDFEGDRNATQWIKDKKNNIDSNLLFNYTSQIDYIENDLNIWNVPSLNTDKGLEVITWNCEFFPTANDSTIKALSEIVIDLDADIIAFQEIKRAGWFEKLMQHLPTYNYILSLQASFMDLAIIFKKDLFELESYSELFADNDYNFAGRPPLRANLKHKLSGTEFSIINLHMKCCDSGLNRRKKASKMLYNHVIQEPDSNFIILGDWNDDLKDKNKEHCFTPFLNDDQFYFANHEIVYDISQASYPNEPYYSFLDHILVNKNFVHVDSINNVMTIPIDQYMNSYTLYKKYISDHMPVLLSFNITWEK